MDEVIALLEASRVQGSWPRGTRHLWADAFGLVLLVSLHRKSSDPRFLDEAKWLADEVDRRLAGGLAASSGATGAIERFHEAAWVFALGRLGRIVTAYGSRAAVLAHEMHRRLVGPTPPRELGHGSRAYGSGSGALDPFFAYVAYRSLDEPGLAREIDEARQRIDQTYRDLVITRDSELGMMLWLSHFHAAEDWAELQRGRCLRVLEHLWMEPLGSFCHEPGDTGVMSPFANHVISIGLQAVEAMPERVERLRHVPQARPVRVDNDSLATVMECCAGFPGELLGTNQRQWPRSPAAS